MLLGEHCPANAKLLTLKIIRIKTEINPNLVLLINILVFNYFLIVVGVIDMPSSFNCLLSTEEGACIIKSSAC